MNIMNFTNLLISGAGFLAEAAETGKRFSFDNVIEGKGLTLTLIGMSVVFCGLLSLFVVLFFLESIVDIGKKFFTGISNLFKPAEEKEKIQEAEGNGKDTKKMTGEEAAAVCMALILYHRLHMSEQRHRITFETAMKPLSPWALSGKVHSFETGLGKSRQQPSIYRLSRHGS